MHKKLEADLISLAHSILQMKNKENVFLLKQKSKEIYEKLAVFAFVEEYVNATPNLKETKNDVLLKIEKAFENKKIIDEELADKRLKNKSLEIDKNKVIEQPFDELEAIFTSKPGKEEGEKEELEVEEVKKLTIDEVALTLEEVKRITKQNNTPETSFKDDPTDVGERKTFTLEEELQDTIPVDIMANLFEPAKPKSLNDKLQNNIQIGLNDRIAFVKNLFNGSQEDFNRVVSQLNTLKTEKEAKKFVNKMVKPDYNWQKHEELEMRFIEIIERKFV